jgi:hypothetical protein
MLVSQRPSEVESTVLSQCNTWIVLRLTNTDDQLHVLKFLPDSMSSLSKILPALRRREAIFIGQAASIPARILLNELSADKLPRSNDIPFVRGWSSIAPVVDKLQIVADRWRMQLRGGPEGASGE